MVSTTDLLTVASSIIGQVFDRSRATRGETVDISKTFNKVWDDSLLNKFKSYGISGCVFGLLFYFSARDGYLFICSLF